MMSDNTGETIIEVFQDGGIRIPTAHLESGEEREILEKGIRDNLKLLIDVKGSEQTSAFLHLLSSEIERGQL